MDFAEYPRVRGVGFALGFLCAFAVFVTILTLILVWTHRLPADWGPFHVAIVVAVLAAIAALVRRWSA